MNIWPPKFWVRGIMLRNNETLLNYYAGMALPPKKTPLRSRMNRLNIRARNYVCDRRTTLNAWKGRSNVVKWSQSPARTPCRVLPKKLHYISTLTHWCFKMKSTSCFGISNRSVCTRELIFDVQTQTTKSKLALHTQLHTWYTHSSTHVIKKNCRTIL